MPEASSTCLNEILARSHDCVARAWPQRLEVLGLRVDSMQFHADLLTEILGESAPPSKNLHLKHNAIEWPKMIVDVGRPGMSTISLDREKWTPSVDTERLPPFEKGWSTQAP